MDNFFHEPTGFYDKINGDVTASGSLGYNITKNVSVLFTGQLGQIDSRFEFYPDKTKLPDNLLSVAHHQKMTFDLHSLGFGLKRTFPISKQLTWFTTIGIDRYTGQLKMNWRHFRDSRGALPEGFGNLVAAEFKKSVWGWNVDAGLTRSIANRLSIQVGIHYRKIKFSRLQGIGSYKFGRINRDVEPEHFIAELVEAPNYFGIRVSEWEGDFFRYLPVLTFLTEPNEDARVPATINLNSFGIRVGIQYSF